MSPHDLVVDGNVNMFPSATNLAAYGPFRNSANREIFRVDLSPELPDCLEVPAGIQLLPNTA